MRDLACELPRLGEDGEVCVLREVVRVDGGWRGGIRGGGVLTLGRVSRTTRTYGPRVVQRAHNSAPGEGVDERGEDCDDGLGGGYIPLVQRSV